MVKVLTCLQDLIYSSHLLSSFGGRGSSQSSLARDESWNKTLAGTTRGLIRPSGSNKVAKVLRITLFAGTIIFLSSTIVSNLNCNESASLSHVNPNTLVILSGGELGSVSFDYSHQINLHSLSLIFWDSLSTFVFHFRSLKPHSNILILSFSYSK